MKKWQLCVDRVIYHQSRKNRRPMTNYKNLIGQQGKCFDYRIEFKEQVSVEKFVILPGVEKVIAVGNQFRILSKSDIRPS